VDHVGQLLGLQECPAAREVQEVLGDQEDHHAEQQLGLPELLVGPVDRVDPVVQMDQAAHVEQLQERLGCRVVLEVQVGHRAPRLVLLWRHVDQVVQVDRVDRVDHVGRLQEHLECRVALVVLVDPVVQVGHLAQPLVRL